MKITYIVLSLVTSFTVSFAQTTTNTFPSMGNVGIGTANPSSALTIKQNNTGMSFHPGGAPFFGTLAFNRESFTGEIFDPSGSAYQINNGGADANLHFQVWNSIEGLVTNNALVISNRGHIGIGTASPAGSLHVKGATNNLSGSRNAIIIDNQAISGNRSSEVIWAANGVGKWEMGNDIGADGGQNFYLFDLENAANPRLFINSTGNVAIGTGDAKGYKLAVGGSIIGESVRVQLQGSWPDYVFEKSYSLPSLEETKMYIIKNGHLSGIPSAEQVKNNGIDLEEMNAALLKKVEELTLHLINKDDQIKMLTASNKSIEERLLKLESSMHIK